MHLLRAPGLLSHADKEGCAQATIEMHLHNPKTRGLGIKRFGFSSELALP